MLRGADCAGVTQLAGAVIDGALAGQDARLGADTAQQNSLIAARLQAGGDVVFDGTTGSGAVIMAGARIGGMLSLVGAAVSANSYGNALNCNGTRIGRDIALNTSQGQQAFTARGTIRMAGAEIPPTASKSAARSSSPAISQLTARSACHRQRSADRSA